VLIREVTRADVPAIEALFETIMAWAHTTRATQVVLDTVDEMRAAIRFYESRGFVRDDRWIRGARCSRGCVLTL